MYLHPMDMRVVFLNLVASHMQSVWGILSAQGSVSCSAYDYPAHAHAQCEGAHAKHRGDLDSVICLELSDELREKLRGELESSLEKAQPASGAKFDLTNYGDIDRFYSACAQAVDKVFGNVETAEQLAATGGVATGDVAKPPDEATDLLRRMQSAHSRMQVFVDNPGATSSAAQVTKLERQQQQGAPQPSTHAEQIPPILIVRNLPVDWDDERHTLPTDPGSIHVTKDGLLSEAVLVGIGHLLGLTPPKDPYNTPTYGIVHDAFSVKPAPGAYYDDIRGGRNGPAKQPLHIDASFVPGHAVPKEMAMLRLSRGSTRRGSTSAKDFQGQTPTLLLPTERVVRRVFETLTPDEISILQNPAQFWFELPRDLLHAERTFCPDYGCVLRPTGVVSNVTGIGRLGPMLEVMRGTSNHYYISARPFRRTEMAIVHNVSEIAGVALRRLHSVIDECEREEALAMHLEKGDFLLWNQWQFLHARGEARRVSASESQTATLPGPPRLIQRIWYGGAGVYGEK